MEHTATWTKNKFFCDQGQTAPQKPRPMLKLFFLSVFLILFASFAKRDAEEIIRDLEARIEAINQISGQHDSQSTCPLDTSNSKIISNDGICALEQSEEKESYFSFEDSDSEAVDTPAADKVEETPVQKGWFSGIRSYFGY